MEKRECRGVSPGWELLREKLRGGGMEPASQNLCQFNTKICDFSYPFYDPTNNSIPYLRAGPQSNTSF